ncbi:MAG TPA: DUF6069 family protein [Streptosporangiaceae bacterium]|nr:DUF6069 family protein [Streptosporangiaceae bacterium]
MSSSAPSPGRSWPWSLGRLAARPGRAFLHTSLVLVAISLVFPLTASRTATTTRLTLALGHLIAAVIVIPIITTRLAHAPGRRDQ